MYHSILNMCGLLGELFFRVNISAEVAQEISDWHLGFSQCVVIVVTW